jgi:hypothetical protein
METVSVTCNHCGAPLTVGEATRFATCKHCGRQLKIVHGESSTYTEVLTGIAETTTRIAEDTAVIRVQNDIERLDREWQDERQQYYSRDKNGTSHPPSVGGLIAGVVVAVVAIGMAVAFFSSSQKRQSGLPPGFEMPGGFDPAPSGPLAAFTLIPCAFAVVVVIALIVAVVKFNQHGDAESVYRRRRAELQKRLDEAQRGRPQ